MTTHAHPYGHFADDGASYVITTPRTPDTWFNYLFNDHYYIRVSQTGQGRAWVRRPTIRVCNREFRFFYLADEAVGACWNLAYVPLKVEPRRYRCTHALGWTAIEAEHDDLATQLRVFVPLEGTHEVWTVRVRNLGPRPRRLALYSVFSFEKADTMGSRCALDPDTGVLAAYSFPHHAFYDEAEPLKRNTGHVFLVADRPPDSVECSQRRFFGGDDVTAFPEAVRAGRLSGLPSEWHDPVGAMQHRLALDPGREAALTLVTGCAASLAEAAQCRRRYATPAQVDAALDEVNAYWQDVSRRLLVRTPDPHLDAFVNHWLKKEIVWETRLWRNGISTPWRNELQDAMGYSIFDPDAAWPFFETLVRSQNASGYFKVWNTRPGHKPNHPLVNLVHNDGPIWLVLCLCAFVDQAGDPGCLDREFPFKDGPPATLYEHLARAIQFQAADLGAHGLCLMHDGDWTDPVNGPGRGGKGESVWASMALKHAILQLLPHALRRGDDERAERFRRHTESLDDAVNRHAWTGQWYAYGFDDSGRPFGTPDDDEGRLYLNTQTWAVISGIARDKRLEACLRTIGALDTPCGPRLLHPPFSAWNDTVGRLSVKLPGFSENGSVYCHAAMFKAFADCLRGDGDAAYDTVRKTLPTNPDNPPERNLQVPIFQANAYFGLTESPNFGQSSQALGTGTCAWMLHTLVNHLLGVRATADGLAIRPCLPAAWDGASVERVFRGARYVVAIRRDDDGPHPEPRVTVDGNAHSGAVLPYEDGATFDVNVIL